MLPDLQALLELSTARHTHLCPRQVLGVRMGLAGACRLGLDVPRRDKRLLVIAETDGCFVDGLQAATGAAPGSRTLRIEDYGKAAATFVDVATGEAMRLAPRFGVRSAALDYAPAGTSHYFAQLTGYQVMPDEELFSVTSVTLRAPVADLVSRPGMRVTCVACGEEIMNEREVLVDGEPYCRACCGRAYYQDPRSAESAARQSDPEKLVLLDLRSLVLPVGAAEDVLTS